MRSLHYLRIRLRVGHRIHEARRVRPDGRGGLKLSQAWAGGMKSLDGIDVHGFTGAFFVHFAQGAD